LPIVIVEVGLDNGRRQRVREIHLPDATGLQGSVVVALTPDARGYAYSFSRRLNELHLMEGLE
jgi:hypothetical protein